MDSVRTQSLDEIRSEVVGLTETGKSYHRFHDTGWGGSSWAITNCGVGQPIREKLSREKAATEKKLWPCSKCAGARGRGRWVYMGLPVGTAPEAVDN